MKVAPRIWLFGTFLAIQPFRCCDIFREYLQFIASKLSAYEKNQFDDIQVTASAAF